MQYNAGPQCAAVYNSLCRISLLFFQYSLQVVQPGLEIGA